jgi:hypothetical protein
MKMILAVTSWSLKVRLEEYYNDLWQRAKMTTLKCLFPITMCIESVVTFKIFNDFFKQVRKRYTFTLKLRKIIFQIIFGVRLVS